MRPALVILAAGASARLGSCKALAELGGRRVLERLLEAGRAVDGGRALLLTGRHHAELSAAAGAACRVIENPSWPAGRSGSVLLAHRALPGRALLLAPVDVPLVPASVFEALAQKWVELGDPASGWLAPRLARPGHPGHGRHGHPVVLGPALLDRLEGLDAGTPLRELRAWAQPLEALEVPAVEILDDLDGPEDLARLGKRAQAGPPPSA